MDRAYHFLKRANLIFSNQYLYFKKISDFSIVNAADRERHMVNINNIIYTYYYDGKEMKASKINTFISDHLHHI